MATYTIYLGANPIACVDGTEAAYACWRATKIIAEITGRSACLVWDETGEVVETFNDEDEGEEHLTEEDLNEAMLEMGFDPYEGGYTWDC